MPRILQAIVTAFAIWAPQVATAGNQVPRCFSVDAKDAQRFDIAKVCISRIRLADHREEFRFDLTPASKDRDEVRLVSARNYQDTQRDWRGYVKTELSGFHDSAFGPFYLWMNFAEGTTQLAKISDLYVGKRGLLTINLQRGGYGEAVASLTLLAAPTAP
jgi:hypothetical protein